jgi:hypothetical protein
LTQTITSRDRISIKKHKLEHIKTYENFVSKFSAIWKKAQVLPLQLELLTDSNNCSVMEATKRQGMCELHALCECKKDE